MWKFARLLQAIWTSSANDVVSPSEFKTQIQRYAPRFMGYKPLFMHPMILFALAAAAWHWLLQDIVPVYQIKGISKLFKLCLPKVQCFCDSLTSPPSERQFNALLMSVASLLANDPVPSPGAMPVYWKDRRKNYLCIQFLYFLPQLFKVLADCRQQDAQEFLRFLLDGLHNEVNRITVRPKPCTQDLDHLPDAEKGKQMWKRYLEREDSRIVELFVGQLKSSLTCTECGYCSTVFDPFWDLSLPIAKKSVPEVSLMDCIRLFTKEDVLDGDEKPTCCRCKARRRCTKKFTIQKFPKILVLHLKRFSEGRIRSSKLSTFVNFPLKDLDLREFSSETSTHATYNLYAVSNHSGTTMGGHYTAYCKSPNNGEWHTFNDSRSKRPVTDAPRALWSEECIAVLRDDEVAVSRGASITVRFDPGSTEGSQQCLPARSGAVTPMCYFMSYRDRPPECSLPASYGWRKKTSDTYKEAHT
ncbi:unnamed protein product [Ranitomeya imitator]|uniref:Ubiquitin carboxyl-terminal hydrolase 2 n=1 Tax=Ranitomeya imitator TaxID=111125 RepID=A0ABN9KVL4_9NEOB|nr:unnamed protein product [Ranitomeya imitator]